MSESTTNRLPIPILVYHQISEATPKGASFRSLCVAPADFARQMACLRWLGYRGLSMSSLMPYLRGQKHGRVVGITFDDGYVNNLTHALPVLVANGFTSTCYAVSQRLGQTNVWDQAAGVEPSRLMHEGELRQWVAAGQEVGAHTRHHVHLPQLDASACVSEIVQCKVELEDAIGQRVDHFCYPYGDYLPVHAEMVARAGYASATTTERSRCHAHESLMLLPRVPVLRTTSLPLFWLKLASGYEDRRRAG